jgi:transitional endoplasmic reticulum ATPase
MGSTLSEVKDNIIVAEIINIGEKLILPEKVSIKQAIDLLEARQKYLTQTVTLFEAFEVAPFDGAHAFNAVVERKYGWTQMAAGSWWEGTKPTLISVEVDNGVFKNVPWGEFVLPGIEGKIQSSYKGQDGRVVFCIKAVVTREYEGQIMALFAELREYLKTGSIYKGKALKVSFKDEDGHNRSVPEVKFWDTNVNENLLVYTKAVEQSIRTNLFTPIQRLADLELNGIEFKRGVGLVGGYGTGKTLAAKVAAKLAVAAGLTYVYVTRADELRQAIEFAKQYQSPGSVVFCEDIDRLMAGDRDADMDDVLNIIDGIDSKNHRIMVVLTSNSPEDINQAMIRPGRLDAVIEVTRPDADAVQRLLRVYGGEIIDADEDLSGPGEILQGQIPATIAEVVKRAKLSQISLNEPGQKVLRITAEALSDAASTMASQLALLNRKKDEAKPQTLESMLRKIAEELDVTL